MLINILGYINITVLPEIKTDEILKDDTNDLIKYIKTCMIKQIKSV